MPRRMFLPLLLLLFAVTSLTTAPSVRADSFFTDFEAGLPPQFSGAGAVVGTEGFSAFGFDSFFLRNDAGGNPAAATTLTLTGLAAHTTVNLSFLLAIIDSWDGSVQPLNPPTAPDFFNVTVDATSAFSRTFSNFNLAEQSFVGAPLTFGTQLGFGLDDFHKDSAYALSLMGIPHTASTLTINFFASGSGWQAGFDESWAIDNVSVITESSVAPIPEPGTLLLLGSGLLGVAGHGRKKLRRKQV